MSFFLFFIVPATVSGRVFDNASRVPLQAHILVQSQARTLICDSLGRFTISNIPPGSQRLVVSHVGFKEEMLVIEVPETGIADLSIGLQQVAIAVEPVTVTGERVKPVIGKQTVQQEEIQIIPGAEKDIFKAIQTLPQVSIPSDYLGLFYVRGGDLYENKILFDDVEVLSPYHHFGIGSAFNVDIIEDFEFYYATFPARYGNAISSVLNIHSKVPTHTISGVISLDMIEGDWFYSCPINKNVGFTFSSKRNYLDFFLKALGVTKDVILPYYVDNQAKLIIRNTGGTFAVSGLKSEEGSRLEAELGGELIKLENDGTGNSLSVGWESAFSDKLKLQTNLFYSDMDRYTFGEVPTAYHYTESAKEEVYSQKYGGTVNVQLKSDAFGFDFGGEAGKYTFKHSGPRMEDITYAIGTLDYSLDVDTFDTYGFVYAAQRFLSLRPLVCEFGERIDWLPIIEEPVFSPRIKLTYDKKPTLYFAYGQQYQVPPLEYGATDIEASYAKGLSLGIEHMLVPSYQAKIELYHKKYHNLVTEMEPRIFMTDGSGYAAGIELSLRKFRTGPLSGWISYSYSVSKRSSPYDPRVDITDVHRPHIFNCVLSQELGKGFEIGIKVQLTSGLAYHPVIGKKYDWDVGKWRPVYAPEKARLPYYQRIDIHMGKTFSLLGMNGQVYVTVLNVTNHKNVQGYIYYEDYTLRKGFYMFPRVPFVGIKLKF